MSEQYIWNYICHYNWTLPVKLTFRSPWCQGLTHCWNTKKTKIRTRTIKHVALARALNRLDSLMDVD